MNPNTIERSQAGISIVQEVFAFVKSELSEAKRRMVVARMGVRGRGRQSFVPASVHSDLGRKRRSLCVSFMLE